MGVSPQPRLTCVLFRKNVCELLYHEQKRILIVLKKRSGFKIFLLQETWHVTPGGVEVEEFEGYTLLHHGETSGGSLAQD